MSAAGKKRSVEEAEASVKKVKTVEENKEKVEEEDRDGDEEEDDEEGEEVRIRVCTSEQEQCSSSLFCCLHYVFRRTMARKGKKMMTMTTRGRMKKRMTRKMVKRRRLQQLTLESPAEQVCGFYDDSSFNISASC